MSDEPGRLNRLSRENSPYLLQHATNPVDWFPWGEEAFTKARQEDKPLFLSIGYSSCHWCHVMREESFADPAIARLMNDSFVAIKVDREERPDIDQVYMQAASLLTGRAGWPLTVFLTPDRLPFYAGTYFPPHARYGIPGLDNVLQRIAELWATDRQTLLSSAETVTAAIRAAGTTGTPRDPQPNLISRAARELGREYDQVHKGFGGPPKFPPPLQCILLLRHWHRTRVAHAREMVIDTFRAMRQGGVYDHVGGGFHRYATDAAWQIPHFEKMLTDQALCALACTEIFQASGSIEFRTTATETLSYASRDLGAPEGGFFTAEDAESEGVEGKFYVWTMEELTAALGDEKAQQVVKFMTIDPEGNFPGPLKGANILSLRHPIAELSAPEAGLYAEARGLLFAARSCRTRPARDEKILCDGNGLAIAAFARAGRVFGEARFVLSAQAAARFLLDRFRRNGRLYHRYYRGETGVTARAGDYAFLVWGLIELYEATFEAEWLAAACELQDECTRHLAHPPGGYFLAPRDEPDLIANPVEARDGAVPAGNGIIFQNLVNLSRLTGDNRFSEQSHALARTFGAAAADAPASYCSYLIALDLAMGPVIDLVVTGSAQDPRTRELIAAARAGYDPHVQILLVPDGAAGDPVRLLAPFTAGLPAESLPPAAHICSRRICSQPVHTPEEVRRMRDQGTGDERIAS